MNMTCRELEALLDEHLDATLEATERESLLRHLHACSACGCYARDYVGAIALARAAHRDEGAPAAGEPDATVESLVQWIRRASQSLGRHGPP